MNEKLYIVRDRNTHLFTKGLVTLLLKSIAADVEPTAEMVRNFASNPYMWTDDLQQADVWTDYWLVRYGSVLPDVEFLELEHEH